MTGESTGERLAPELGQQVVNDLAALNEGFIELLIEARRQAADLGTVLRMPAEQVDAITRLRPTARRRLTHCAFALFDLRLDDARFWAASAKSRELLPIEPNARVDQILDKRSDLFALCALMYLRHLACVNRFLARLSFDAHDDALDAICAASLTSVQQIVIDYPGLLRCRLGTDNDAWTNLLRLARRNDGQPLLPARILGLQHQH